MTEKPKCQTVAEAAEEWTTSKDGKFVWNRALMGECQWALNQAFAAGVEWMKNEVNEARRKAGARH